MLIYNRAVLFASCADEAEKDRPLNPPRIPWENNLVMTTCVEIKVGQDEEVLSALDLLPAQRGTLDLALSRLESALRSKIAAEDG